MSEWLSDVTQARLRAAVVAITPVVVLIGFLYAPYIGDLTDNAAIADEVAADSTRWAWAHLVQVIGLALAPLLVFAIRTYLRAAGENLWSFIAVPLVTVGAAFLAFLTGGELLMTAVVETGTSVEEVLDAADPWVTPTIIVAIVMIGLGWLSLAAAIYRSEVLGRELTWVVVAALVVFSVANLIPLGWALYVMGAALIVALWPIAYQMWTETREAPMAAERPSPA